ncbi:MAG: sugar-binding protein [Armatimonadota bacterium]
MRHIVVALTILTAASASCAADDYPIYVYPCPRASAAPVIDGLLSDDCWRNAPAVGGFTLYDRPEAVQVQTFFRVTYDDEAVYFGVLCEEPLTDKLSPTRTARDDHGVFRQEAIEFFIDPQHSHQDYYQFAASAAGSLYDSRKTDSSWNSSGRTAAHIADGQWSLELAIPWADLKVTPRPGAIIGFNVCRDREVGLVREWTNWSQTMANFHDPDRFAHLVLSPTAEQLGALGDEFRKGDRTGPLRIFSAEGFSDTSYRALARLALANLDRLLADLQKVLDEESDAATRAELESRIARHRRQTERYRARIEGEEPIDAVAWSALERDMRALAQRLGAAVWEARLSALLSNL